jgi:hypothetical protein
MLKDLKETNLKLIKAKELVADVSRLTEHIDKDESNQLEKTLKDAEEKENRIEVELGKLPESDEWKRLLEMKRMVEEIRQKMQNKKADFIACISQVEIPLKKYNWSAKNKVLDYYLQRSFDLILSEDARGEIFKSVIREIKVKILEGEMILKDSDKFLDIISRMIEDDTVRKIISEYLKLSEELKKQEEKSASQGVLKRKDYLENNVKELKKEIWELKNEKEIAEKRIKETREDREQKLKELETMLNIFSNKKVLLQTN